MNSALMTVLGVAGCIGIFALFWAVIVGITAFLESLENSESGCAIFGILLVAASIIGMFVGISLTNAWIIGSAEILALVMSFFFGGIETSSLKFLMFFMLLTPTVTWLIWCLALNLVGFSVFSFIVLLSQLLLCLYRASEI